MLKPRFMIPQLAMAFVLSAGLTTPAQAQASPSSNSDKPPIPADLLRSARGINYAELQDLLRAGRWENANQLTSRLVLQVANQTRQGYLIATDIRSLACPDLQTINRLWLYYSNGQYGFSPQADIWRQLGGQDYPTSVWFERMVGWSLPTVIPNPAPTTTPKGYLPFRPAYETGIRNAFGGGWIREMPLRLDQCARQS